MQMAACLATRLDMTMVVPMVALLDQPTVAQSAPQTVAWMVARLVSQLVERSAAAKADKLAWPMVDPSVRRLAGKTVALKAMSWAVL